MSICSKKRRYSLTLTPDNVTRFQGLCKDFGMPPATLSKACDDVIRDLCVTFETAREQGYFNLEDFFRVVGNQLQLTIDQEDKANDQKSGKGVSKGKTGK